jgi:lysozyme family protein
VEPPSGDNWQRSREFVRRWEGGYQNNPADIGNWTGCAVGKGENKGTNFGISACSYPELDIPNLTMAEADAIYFKDYWQASGADKLPWPYCLLVFDTAVLHGVGAAQKWQQEVGDNAYAFAAKRMRVYTKLGNWSEFGAGWTNRVADLLVEASKP